MNWADKALIGITIVALLAVVIPISIGLAGEDDDLNVTGNFLLNSVYGQTDFGATSSETISEFESITDMTPPPDDIVMTPPPNNIFTGGDTPFNEYTFPPPQPIEITTPVTGLVELPHGLETVTYEKFQDGYTWEVDENGLLYNLWDEERIGSIPEPKPEYPQVTENYTIVQNDDDTFTYLTHDPYIADKHEWKPYIIGEDDQVVQIQTNGGTVVFDKVAGAVTIFNEYGMIVDSDSYMVRTALLDSDVWTNLDVSDADVETVVVENGDKVTVSFVRENTEGKFTSEYVIHSGNVKTTVYFTNYIYENNKFAFTQTLDLPDNIISVNGMDDIDLNDYVGVSFDRETLEANMDLVLKIKNIHYSSGLGFDNLWSVNVVTPTKVSLDYANVDELQTAIGETVELDPTYTLNSVTMLSSGQSTSAQIGSNSPADVSGCGGRLSETQGSTPTWNLRNYVGPEYTWNGCRVATVGFDLTSIPDSAIISDTKLKYDIFYNNNAPNFVMNQLTQRGQDGWGLWGSVSTTSGTPQTGDNPYSVYCTTSCPPGGTGANGAHLKNWDIYLDANNLGTQPNGAGHQYAYNIPSAVGTNLQTDLGAQGNADVQAQLKHSTSVDGVGDWFGIGLPLNTMINGATAATYWTSPSVQTSAVQDMDFENVQLQVTYYSPPSSPANVTVTPNGGSVDLAWSASEIYSDYEVSTHANSNPVHIAGTAGYGGSTVTCSGGSASVTAPTLGQAGVIGNSMYFDGVCDSLNPFDPNADSTQGSDMTLAVWLKSDAGSSSVADIPFGKIGAGYNYLILNNMWSSYGYANNSVTVNGLYSAADAFPPNVWNHYAVTIAADNTTHLYINGVDIPLYNTYNSANHSSSTLTTAGSANADSMYGWNIGSGKHTSTNIGTYFYAGWMDDMIVWHDVLTPAEIAAVHEGAWTHPYNIVGANTLEYYMPFDDSSFPLENYVALSQPSKYDVTYYVNRDGSNINLNTQNLSVTDTTTSFNTPYVYSLQGYNNAGGGGKWSESPYEVSSDAVISDGTNNGATTGVGGVVGNAWSFAGTGITAGADYVSGIDTELQDSSNNGYTMSMWFKPSALNGDVNYVFEMLGAVNFFNQFLLGDGSIYVTGTGASSAGLVSNGSWHHLVTSVDSSDNATVYLNGSSIMTGSVPTWAAQNQGEFYIGARAPYNQNGFGGSIDEVSVWDRNLSSSEVTSLYANGSPEPVNMQSWITGSDLTQYYNFEQTGNTLTNMAVTEDPSNFAITLTVEPPTNLSATVNAPNVDLSWTGGTGATGYKIETSTNGTTWTNVVANASPNASAWTWDSSQSLGMSVLGDTVINSLSYNGWDNYIRTTGTISSGDITYKTPDAVTGSNIFVGLGQDPIYLGYNSYSSVDYAMNVCNTDCDTIKIWEEGTNVDTVTGTGFDPATSILKISMDSSGIVTYYHNGTLISTSSNAGSGSYYGHTAINESGKSVSILNESYSHTAPVQNTTNYYKVTTLIGSDVSTANTGSSTITPVNYRTYTATASASTCDTGTITADILHEIGMPSQTGGNRYCLVTSMEYDISAISDAATITSAVIEESHSIWSTGFSPSCDYKSNMSQQPSTSTAQEKWDSVIAGIVYANDPACITGYTSGNVYDVPLSAQAVTDIETQLSGDWFGINWAIDNFPSLANAGTVGTPSSIFNGSSLLKLEYLAPADIAVGGTPDAPTGLTTTFNNSTLDMDLAWTAPVNNNGSAVTGYKIETSLDNGATWTTVITTTNTNTTYSHVSPTVGVINYYKVSAINAYGAGTPTGISNALAGGPPDAPTNLTVSYNSPNADLTWVAPTVTNGSAVIGYKVETSLDNSTWSPVTVLTNTNVTYSHPNPTVGVDNYYRVSAINSIGTGVPGNVASVLAALVPTAPLTLTTTQTVPFAHDLSWSVPSNDGGSPVTNYKVYRDGSLITTLGNVTTYQDNTMQHIAHTHSYEVSAVNLVGESPMSNASSITSWNVPDATTGVTATARAGQQNELNWTAPSNGGSPITGYHIKSSTDNITFTDVVATTTTQPYNHTGLTQGTTYYYQISAISAVGEGAFGTASATVGDVPDAPVSLTVVPQAGMQATITITIPNDNGYAISSYTLHRSSDNFATFTVLNSQASNVIVDYPLNIGTSYQYKALATNSLGDSALSVASATALAGDVPSTPVAPGTVVATT